MTCHQAFLQARAELTFQYVHNGASVENTFTQLLLAVKA
jgi:hypothetical protein